MVKKIVKFWPIFLLVALTFFLRTIWLEQLFYFTYDESIPAFVGRRLLLWGHLPLIGGVTPFNFHLAPYFYWFLSLTLILFKLNPIIWGWVAAAIAMVTTSMMYIVGSSLGSRRTAMTAAILWTFSYLANVYDRHLWALYWGPLISLVVIYCLNQLIRGKEKYVYLLALTTAFGIHTDPSNLVFLALTIISWFIFKLPFKKSTLIAILIIISSFLPLVIFDLRHNFSNTKPVLTFLKSDRNKSGFEPEKLIENSLLFPQAASRLVYTFGDNEISKQYSYCQSFIREKFQKIPNIFVLVSLVLLCIFIVKNLLSKKNSTRTLISLLIVLYFLGIHLYGTIFRADIFEHYITGIFATLLLIVAFFITKLPKNIWIIFLAIFMSVNLLKFLNAKNGTGLSHKKQAIDFAMNYIGGAQFSLDSLSTCWKYSGYRYLFAVFGREPVKSYVDPNFAYLYGTTAVSQKHPEIVVTLVIHDFTPETETFYKRYGLLKSREIKNGLFGNIEVIIMDNSTGWFGQASSSPSGLEGVTP